MIKQNFIDKINVTIIPKIFYTILILSIFNLLYNQF